jgi:hypothetical protein
MGSGRWTCFWENLPRMPLSTLLYSTSWLPGKDGFTVAAVAGRQAVSVLMLTARGRPEDVLGFCPGATTIFPNPSNSPSFWPFAGTAAAPEWMQQSLPPNVPAGGPWSEAFSFHGRTIDFGKLELREGDTIS